MIPPAGRGYPAANEADRRQQDARGPLPMAIRGPRGRPTIGQRRARGDEAAGRRIKRGRSMTRWYSNASRAPRVGPGDLPGSIAVIPSPDDPLPVGIASEVGRVGGHDWELDRDLGPPEAVWSLVIAKHPIDGRFALRGGRFVPLAGEAG